MKLFVIQQLSAMMELHKDELFGRGVQLVEIRNEWPDITGLRVEPCFPKKWEERDINKVNRTNRSPGSMLGKKKWWDK